MIIVIFDFIVILSLCLFFYGVFASSHNEYRQNFKENEYRPFTNKKENYFVEKVTWGDGTIKYRACGKLKDCNEWKYIGKESEYAGWSQINFNTYDEAKQICDECLKHNIDNTIICEELIYS